MPASVYRLVFKDPELKKFDPSSMKIGTYTTDTVEDCGFLDILFSPHGHQENT